MRHYQLGEISFIELLIIIAIMVILASVLISAYKERLGYLDGYGITPSKIHEEIMKCEEALPRNRKCVIKYQVVPE